MRLIPARLWGLAVLSSVLQILPFPIAGPVPVWRTAFCWVALLPLFYALLGATEGGKPLSIRQGTALAYASGVLWYLGNCYWIFPTMNIYGGLSKPVAAGILLLFCLYLGLYHALFGAVLMAIRRSRAGCPGALVLAPFVWVAVELARARITGLPWDLLGVAQVDNPLLTRLAPWTGAYGLSFVIAAVNALWLVRVSLRERRFMRPLLTLGGVLILLAYVFGLHQLVIMRVTRPTATATLLQQNLEVGEAARGQPPETEEQRLASFSALSLAPARHVLNGIPELPGTKVVPAMRGGAGDRQSDVLIWPESPAFEEQDLRFRAEMSHLARAGGFPVIVDDTAFAPSREAEKGFAPRNSASFVTPDGLFVSRYDKMHLVPFGEYTPFRRLFFFAGHLLDNVGIFEPGTERVIFQVNSHGYGTFICYESIFGDEIRQFVQRGADVLVNISDDGWYGDSSAPWQHLNMVRMRAIENHRWVLRATNTGVTGSIDPFGRVVAAAPRHLRTAIQVPFGYEDDLTFYTRYGDLFAYLCAAVTTVALGWSLWQRGDALR
jgi:apolipoprotein N-acyltransferase